MAQITYAAALHQLEQGRVEQRYLLLGDEYHQQFLLSEQILAARLAAGERAYGKTEISGAKANPHLLQEALSSVPLLGCNTGVIVSNLQRLRKEAQEFLLAALPKIDPTVTFIGIANKLDGRTKLGKQLASLCLVIKLRELNNQQLPGYIESRFTARELRPTEDAITEMCRVVGRDCGDIENEVEKVSIAFAGQSQLSLGDISSYLAASRQFGQYEVADYLANRRLATAIKGVQQVLASGGSAARSLFWAMSGQLERLLLYPELSKSLSQKDLAGRLRTSPFFLKNYERQSKKWQPEELTSALEEIYQVAAAERFGAESPQQIWERALLRILGSSGGE